MKILRINFEKSLLVGLFLIAAFLLFSCPVHAEQEGDYTYSISNGQAQITRYTGSGSLVTIPSTLGGCKVASIGDCAFNSCNAVTGVIIPSGVTAIGNNVFQNCNNLAMIDMSYGVQTIGHNAFSDCPLLTSIKLPDSITTIDYRAFGNCPVLANVVLPNSLTSIEQELFSQCKSINSITIPESVKSIGMYAFWNCYSLNSLVVPANVQRIDGWAFLGCTGLRSITFNSTSTALDEWGRAGSEKIPNTITIIGYSGSTAEQYANKYSVPFKSLDTYINNSNKLIIGEDNNSFPHCGSSFFDGVVCVANPHYDLSDKLYKKLVTNLSEGDRNTIHDEMLSEWGGACQGISSAMALSKVGEIKTYYFDMGYYADNFYDMQYPAFNDKVRYLFHYYQLAQYIPDVNSKEVTSHKAWYYFDAQSVSKTLSKIVDKTKNIEQGEDPLLITLGWMEPNDKGEIVRDGHCVVGNGCEIVTTGNHKGDYAVQIVDPNVNNQYIYLVIKPDFSSHEFMYKDYKGEFQRFKRYTDTWTDIGYFELDALDSINIGYDDVNNYVVASDGTKIYVSNFSDYKISNTNGEDLISTEQDFSGNLNVESIKYINKSTTQGEILSDTVINLANKGYYKITPTEGRLEASIVESDRYASINANNISDVEFVSGNNMNINGNNCDFTACVSNPSGEGLIYISEGNSNNAKIEQTSEGIVVKTDNKIDNLQIKINKDPNSASDQLALSTDQNEVLIKDKVDDDTGACQLLVSENNDDNFNKVIGETSAVDPNNEALYIKAPEDITMAMTGTTTPTSLGTAVANGGDALTITNNAPVNGFPIGTTVVTWTVTDANGKTSTATQKVTINYVFAGFTSPIDGDGTSTAKSGSTIPVKFQLKDANGNAITSAKAKISYAPIKDGVVGSETDLVDPFKFNGDHYQYNFKTKGLSNGSYQLSIKLDDGSIKNVNVYIK